jgi:hypothetical protein
MVTLFSVYWDVRVGTHRDIKYVKFGSTILSCEVKKYRGIVGTVRYIIWNWKILEKDRYVI